MQTSPSVAALIHRQRQFFQTGATRSRPARRQALQRLRQGIGEQQDAILAALRADLGKPNFEALGSEIVLCIDEITYVLRHWRAWMRPQPVAASLVQRPGRAYTLAEPLGTVLILSPWNYPFQLAIAPLIGAIAAGNTAILKPSEIAPHTSQAIARLVADCFAPEWVTVVEGDKEAAQALLAEPFDHIFFTGSTQIGKVVMRAAAEHLTPVTLELGGKCPAIVTPDITLKVAVRRLVWGKFINAGQTCVAPDYLLVHRSVQPALLGALRTTLREFYGEDPAASLDYARIVSDAHFWRLHDLLERDRPRVVIGGETRPTEHYIAPTVLSGCTWDDATMAAEIFGPLLPVLVYDRLEEAIAQINARPKPLALYLFSTDAAVQRQVQTATSSGGFLCNDTILHLSSPRLPFGGVGMSGLGSYRGRASFETFSHRKSVLSRSFWLDLPLRYPPYAGKEKWLKLFFR
ncbi:MAG: aldehyde dehydrogenase [Spirulinaceae cyanobacterium SM2_1_0]|nr:aldehyde dehydrogenase [Spirulinaceae cyanobacterium SM2_1_0]